MFLNSMYVFKWPFKAYKYFCSIYFDIKHTVYTPIQLEFELWSFFQFNGAQLYELSANVTQTNHYICTLK